MSAVKELGRPVEALAVSLTGYLLLYNPVLNKGSAFSPEERREFGLLGLLPPHTSTMEEQSARAYENYMRKETDVERYVYARGVPERTIDFLGSGRRDDKASTLAHDDIEPVAVAARDAARRVDDDGLKLLGRLAGAAHAQRACLVNMCAT